MSYCSEKASGQEQIGPQLKFFWPGHRSVQGERVVMLLTVLLSCLEEGTVHSWTHTHTQTHTQALMKTCFCMSTNTFMCTT